MSRSYRRTPAGGICSADSERWDKQKWHRRERRAVKEALTKQSNPEILPHKNELSNPWSMAKDGKTYWGRHARPQDLRK